MSKFTLVYTGPETRRGPELCSILHRHPQARFVEKDLRHFEVTAETDFADRIANERDWRADRIDALVN